MAAGWFNFVAPLPRFYPMGNSGRFLPRYCGNACVCSRCLLSSFFYRSFPPTDLISRRATRASCYASVIIISNSKARESLSPNLMRVLSRRFRKIMQFARYELLFFSQLLSIRMRFISGNVTCPSHQAGDSGRSCLFLTGV
jgi:hypothetical protein